MAFAQVNLSSGDSGGLERWALLQTSRRGRTEQAERQKLVTERLSELLFGLDLNAEEMALYRARLLDALTRIDQLEQEPSLVPIRPPVRIPKDEMLLRIGGFNWRPFEVSQSSLEIPTGQKIFRQTLAKAVRSHIELNPKSEPRSYHEVGIVVAQGAEGTRHGSDRVELSSWGLEAVQMKDFPNVTHLRLPPRFPSRADIISFRAS